MSAMTGNARKRSLTKGQLKKLELKLKKLGYNTGGRVEKNRLVN